MLLARNLTGKNYHYGLFEGYGHLKMAWEILDGIEMGKNAHGGWIYQVFACVREQSLEERSIKENYFSITLLNGHYIYILLYLFACFKWVQAL